MRYHEDLQLTGMGDGRERYEYLDFLATALTQHEKNLDYLIERLEKISAKLSDLVQSETRDTPMKNNTVVESTESLMQKAHDLLSD